MEGISMKRMGKLQECKVKRGIGIERKEEII